MQDFSNAAPSQDFSLIPAGTLCFGILKIRAAGGDENNQPIAETQAKTSDSRYLDCDITVLRGPFSKRKIFTKIGTGGSEKYINMGRSSIRSILEVGRGASQANLPAYQIKDYMDLNGLTVAVEVKIEKQSGFADKNEVATYLTPNADSSTHKKFNQLVEMDKAGYPKETSAAPAQSAATQPTPTWATQAAPAQAAQAQPATNKPTWLQ